MIGECVRLKKDARAFGDGSTWMSSNASDSYGPWPQNHAFPFFSKWTRPVRELWFVFKKSRSINVTNRKIQNKNKINPRYAIAPLNSITTSACCSVTSTYANKLNSSELQHFPIINFPLLEISSCGCQMIFLWCCFLLIKTIDSICLYFFQANYMDFLRNFVGLQVIWNITIARN